jgi:transposase InsO family protein
MPWEERTVKMSRETFVAEVKSGEKSKSQLCREYGISRKTGDKWLKRFENGEGLSDRSKAPFHVANKTPPEKEEAVLAVRAAHPAWGPRKIRHFMLNKGLDAPPSKSAIGNILKRNGCISEAASAAAKPYKRFQKESSNEMWQTDFKGHFAMKDGNRCHPLTVLDDYSRFSLCVDAKENEKHQGVKESFERLFEENGLPDSLLCDNGNPWGNSQTTGYTRFEVLLMEYDVLPIHGRINHPQTQGKEERFHKTMKAELLKQIEIENMAHAQMCFDDFRACYNNERPHEALNMGVPAEYYRKSQKIKPDKIYEWDYPNNCVLRKIKPTGYLTYGNQGYFLSEAFDGKVVAVRESSLENCINVYFRSFRIARINVKERAFVSRKIYRTNHPGEAAENLIPYGRCAPFGY